MHKASNLWKKMSAHLYSTDLIFKQTFEETVRIFLQILPNATGEKPVC